VRRVPVHTTAAAARPLARQPSRSLHLLFGACGIPHPSKAAKGGEDAFFCDEAKGTFGVADGVGGSASAFVDPGEFSRALLRSCDERLDGSCEALRAVLAGTAQRLREAPVAGSSTLLVGQLGRSARAMSETERREFAPPDDRSAARISLNSSSALFWARFV